jgi:hypothetical protein
MHMESLEKRSSRRSFLAAAAAGGAALSAAWGLDGLVAGETTKAAAPRGKAEHCVFLWLGGGACHIDTWDPKRRGDAAKKLPGSYYDAIPCAIQGEQVCEHLRRSAPLLDRAVLVRSVHHDVIDEHAAAVNRMHTGRPTSGTVIYPSIGSIVAHELGGRGESVPAYVVMGYPNVTRGPGFLGARYGYIYLTDTETGPAGLARPPGIGEARQRRREGLIRELREGHLRRHAEDDAIRDYAEASAEAFRLAGPEFMDAFRLDREAGALREAYGSEFGQRCLLARRLVERGVRFIEVAHNLNFINGTGWDTHNQGQLKQHLLIEELDKAFSTLILDLEEKKLLEKTLVVISTEFGRPPQFDGGGGRGHHSKAFTVVLAGGGLRSARVVGLTDELGESIIERPISVPDLFATACTALGIDSAKELHAGDRPVPITDQGRPIAELFG